MTMKLINGKRCTPQGVPYTNGEYFINADNQYLFAKVWKPAKDQKPRAIVFVSHGMAEHCLCYEETVAGPLNEAGYIVVSHDHIGHGQSEGDRIMVNSFHSYIRDVIDHIEETVGCYSKDLPVFILGHSMGGIIGVLTALERPDLIWGIILNGTAVKVHPKTGSALTKFMARFLALVCPHLPIIKLPIERFSSDPSVVDTLRVDPYRYHGGVKAKSLLQYMQAVMSAERRLGEFSTPILVAHGTHDKLASPDGSQSLYESVNSPDKELVFFEGCYHQLHWEPNGQKERFIHTVIDWISARI